VREIVFALEFRGSAGPSGGPGTTRRARTSAPSQTLRTLLGPDGIVAGAEPVSGDEAVLDSTVERFLDEVSWNKGPSPTAGSAGCRSRPSAGARWARVPSRDGCTAPSRGLSREGPGGSPAPAASSHPTSSRAPRARSWTTSSRGSTCRSGARPALAGGGARGGGLLELRGHVDEDLSGIKICGDRLGT
jgi:hypothetical protein